MIGEWTVPAGRSDFGFEVAAPHDDAEGVGASSADVEIMHDGEYALLVRGSATKDAESVTFEVGFPFAAAMTECTNGVDDTDGVVIEDAGTTDAEITVHLEHLLYDKLGGHEGVELRFAAWAAAAGDDGHVDADDLETALLSDLPEYDPESVDVDNLHDFATDAVVAMFHLNGEGLCGVNGEVHDHDHDDE